MKPDEFDGRLPLTADACKKWYEDELLDGIIAPDVHGSRRTCRRMVRIARTLPMLVLPADATVDETTWVWSDLHIRMARRHPASTARGRAESRSAGTGAERAVESATNWRVKWGNSPHADPISPLFSMVYRK